MNTDRMNVGSRMGLSTAAAIGATLLAGDAAIAQFGTGFEAGGGYAGAAAGVVLTGQNGWYIPAAVAGSSIDCEVYDYAANALGIAGNPCGGGGHFAAGLGPGGGDYARDQHPVPGFLGGDVWGLVFDVAVKYNGVLPAAQNVGSMSTQGGPDSATFVALAKWVDPATAAKWNANYVHYTAAGVMVTEPVPAVGFTGLKANKWYKWHTKFEFSTNKILEVAMLDCSTGVLSVFAPVDWYMKGGDAGGGRPDCIRLFAGAPADVGNVFAIDNVIVVPLEAAGAAPAPAADVDRDGTVTIRDLSAFQEGAARGDPAADVNRDGRIDALDAGLLLKALGARSP